MIPSYFNRIITGDMTPSILSKRKSDRRYPIALPVRYAAREEGVIFAKGTGRTSSIGGKSIVFVTEQPLLVGLNVDLTMDWPALLDNSVPLQIAIRGKIGHAEGNQVLLQISGHEFRTRAARIAASKTTSLARSIVSLT
ncbi:MAG: hypothetical protein C5B51_25070 [Terriglobia bacterium]|nr:MAG: hypothetical protein C5B51_25070 [Terriglobia bacterium]